MDNLSNKQISTQVAMAKGLKVAAASEYFYGDGVVVYPHSNEINFDPCNKFEDWFPLAEELGMTIDVKGNASVSGISFACPKQLGRAVSLCYLQYLKETS